MRLQFSHFCLCFQWHYSKIWPTKWLHLFPFGWHRVHITWKYSLHTKCSVQMRTEFRISILKFLWFVTFLITCKATQSFLFCLEITIEAVSINSQKFPCNARLPHNQLNSLYPSQVKDCSWIQFTLPISWPFFLNKLDWSPWSTRCSILKRNEDRC